MMLVAVLTMPSLGRRTRPRSPAHLTGELRDMHAQPSRSGMSGRPCERQLHADGCRSVPRVTAPGVY